MLNGEIMPSDKPCLMYNNRGLLWGDSFSIKLRGNSCFVYDFGKYFSYLCKQTEMLDMIKNDNFTEKILANDISLLLKKNRIYKEFVATITIFRNSDNTDKLADQKTFSTLMSAESITPEHYQLNKDGIFTDIFTLPENLSSRINSQFPFELLCRETMKEQKLDDMIITDNQGYFLRSLFSNIFFTKGNLLISASVYDKNSEHNIFASRIIEFAEKKLEMKVLRHKIGIQNLKDIEGMFLADAINGIRWVVGLERKRFYQGNKVADIAFEVYNYYKNEIEKLKKLL